MRPTTRLLGAAVVAGIIATGGSAFTGAGLSFAGHSATDHLIAGGRVQTAVDGAEVSNIQFNPLASDTGGTKITSVTVTFTSNATSNLVGRSVELKVYDSSGYVLGQADPASAVTSDSDDVDLTPDNFVCQTVQAGYTSTCSLYDGAAPVSSEDNPWVANFAQASVAVH